ncbi:hypothetical protein J6590_043272 [Homalodisca vitripennis]|nr:hypothetical protein J6590_043272 [Homalodisca vitripennis]
MLGNFRQSLCDSGTSREEKSSKGVEAETGLIPVKQSRDWINTIVLNVAEIRNLHGNLLSSPRPDETMKAELDVRTDTIKQLAKRWRGQGIEQAGECRAVVGILGEGGITAAEGYLPHPA